MTIEQLDLEFIPATVLDVGAFRGDFALSALRRHHQADVLSFEPLEPEPRKAMRNYRRRWRWFPVALGAAPGRVTIHRNEFIPSSSMLPMLELHREAFPYTRRTDEVEVGMAALDEFFELVTEPAVLKIDVQGYELEVLKGAADVLSLCAAIACEVSHAPLYEGTPSQVTLNLVLREAGFVPSHRIEELHHPETGDLLQSDELWVRG